MFIRRVNGRFYIARSIRAGGRTCQIHLGPADEGSIALLGLLKAEKDNLRQANQLLLAEANEREEALAGHWERVQREFASAMKQAGYHNLKSRGWKKKMESQE